MKGELIHFRVIQGLWALRMGKCPKCRSHLVHRLKKSCVICGWRAYGYVEPYVYCNMADSPEG